MTPFRWGIFGTGAVSAKFVAGLAQLPDASVTLVASRDLKQADAFADRFGIAHRIAGYEAAATAAPGLVDAIYIATPPALHRDHALACLAAGVPVLIEKPFAPDAETANEIVAAARSRALFCMEAMWTRFMPALTRLRALVAEGAVGEPRMIVGSFGASSRPNPAAGNFDPALGGGALAHLGIYPVSLGQWLFGAPVDAQAIGRVGETGVEEDAAIALRYASGVVGSFHTSLRATPANDLAVHGTEGSLRLLGPVYRPWGIERRTETPRGPGGPLTARDIRREGHRRHQFGQLRAALRSGRGRIERHFYAGNGYHYEAAEVARMVRAGQAESAIMPLADSLAVAATLDRLRASIRGARP